MSRVKCEAIAATALREWLLAQLPAKVTTINAARAATLKATTVGPYTIPSSATLGLCVTPASSTFTSVSLTSGSRTTTQLVSEINTAMGSTVASADFADRLTLSGVAPTAASPSKIWVRGGTASDCNSVFGWSAGGEKATATALVAPGVKGVCDGLPLVPDFAPNAAAGGSVIVCIIGDRKSKPIEPAVRRDEYLVTLDLSVLRIEPEQLAHRNKEPIQSAVQCVREVLLQDAGRQLGRASQGDIMLVRELSCAISGASFKFKDAKVPNPFFDGASMTLEVRVFERPDAT